MTTMRRVLASRDRGFTMAELLVTMMLMSIISAVVLSTVVIVGRNVVRDQAKGDSLDIARVGMNRVSKAVRAGTEVPVNGSSNLPAFAEIGPETLTVYASLGSAPTKTQYTIDAQRQLIETQWAADTSNAPYYTFATTPRVTEIASQIPASSGLFKFYDANGALVSPQTTTDPTVLSLVRSVEINLMVNSNPTQNVPPVSINSTVVLPNLGVVKR